MEKITVIVPAYNVEKYLAETLDSLVQQTLDDFEVIIVNDGSTDSTQKIIDEYCKEYSYMTGVYQENAGVSAARNKGLAMAEGKYIFFLDSDDLLPPEALENLYNTAEENESDLVLCRVQLFDENSVSWQEHVDKMLEKQTIEKFDKEILWNFIISNKLYRAELIRSSSTYFPNLKYSEEGVFLMHYVYACKRISICKDAYFRYRRYSGSVSQSISHSLVHDYIGSHMTIYSDAQEALEKLPEEKHPDGYLDEVLYKTAHVLILQFYRLFWQTDDECRLYIKEQLELLWERLPEKIRKELISFHDDIEIENLIATGKELAENPRISVIVKNMTADKNAVEELFNSIYLQSMPAFEVIVPQSLYDSGKIPERWINCENLKVLPDKKFMKNAKASAKAAYKVKFKKPCVIDKRVFRFVYRTPSIPAMLKNTMFSFIIKEMTRILQMMEARRG